MSVESTDPSLPVVIASSRDQLGRFRPGVSGNPTGYCSNGKKPISRSKQTFKLAEHARLAVAQRLCGLAVELPPPLEAMVQKMISGDVRAGELLLSRFIPTPRQKELPSLGRRAPAGATLTQQGEALAADYDAGRISATERQRAQMSLEAQARTRQLDEVPRQVAALTAAVDEIKRAGR